ncbi:MAG TPA: hypothetical protein VGO11_01285 [Chthoniobacteraceae bacterium]|jgi:hypothetical protein|nr:hypothetical protein [Chthoniobacteraceae bacterium]
MKLLLPLFALALAGVAAEPTTPPLPPLPTAHQTRTLEGWTVRVDERLLSGPDSATGERALKLLDARLMEIGLVMSAEPLAKLREIPIQLDLNHGALKVAQYHPSAGWLKEHGYSEQLEKCVHIPNAAQFLSRYENHRMPFVLLHELAHGYHDRVLGFENARIAAIWEKWKEGMRGHEVVLMDNGTKREHYGLTNAKEFFAEMTESYLGQNDFYPFNAGELAEAAPDVYKMMVEIWGPLPGR